MTGEKVGKDSSRVLMKQEVREDFLIWLKGDVCRN